MNNLLRHFYEKNLRLLICDANGARIEPFAFGGNLFIPVEGVAEAFGFSVNWIPDSHRQPVDWVSAGIHL